MAKDTTPTPDDYFAAERAEFEALTPAEQKAFMNEVLAEIPKDAS